MTLVATVMLWASLTLDPSAPYLASWWATSFSFATFVAGVVVANVVLSLFSSLSGYIATKEGITYSLAAERVFGTAGVVVPSTWAGLVCIGWLAFSIGVVADGIVAGMGLPGITYFPLVIFMTALFSITAYLGVRHIVKLAYVGVPLLVVLIVSALAISVSRWGVPALGAVDLAALPVIFGLVLGTFVNGSITLSFDYQRFCRRVSDSVLTAFVNFLGFWSFIIIASAIPAATVGKDLYGTYSTLGLSWLAIATLFLLAWTSADNQLYSASLSWSVSLKAIGRTASRRKIVVVAAALTAALALARLHTFAVQWLSLMTSISLPAGIVIWTDYYTKSGMRSSTRPASWRPAAFASWAIGSITVYYLYVLSGYWYGLLIGFLLTAVAYFAMSRGAASR